MSGSSLDVRPVDTTRTLDDDEEGVGPVRGPVRAIFHSGYLPVVLVGLFAVAILAFHGVPVGTVAVFVAYVGLGVTLPGTLLVRLLNRGSGWLVADLALG